MFATIREDINSILARDPAANSRLMVILCYPGLHAVWMHRITAPLWRANLRLIARLLSQFARLVTGIELSLIHI